MLLVVWYALFGLYLVSLPILPRLFGGCDSAQCGCGLFGDADVAPVSDWGYTVSHYIAAPVARGVFAALSAGPVATVWLATSTALAKCQGDWAIGITVLVAGYTAGWVVFLASSVCGDATETALHAAGVYTSVACAVPLYLMIAAVSSVHDDDNRHRRLLRGDYVEDATMLLVATAALSLGLFVVTGLLHSQRDDVPSHLPWFWEVVGLMAAFALPLHIMTTRRGCTDTPRT